MKKLTGADQLPMQFAREVIARGTRMATGKREFKRGHLGLLKTRPGSLFARPGGLFFCY
jgi:hypothetical protein